MCRVALLTNIPAPYRVDLFYYMQTHIKEHELYIIYAKENEENRSWKICKEKLLNSYILHSHTIKVKGGGDARYIHIAAGIGEKMDEINPDVVIAWEYNLVALQALWWSKRHSKKFIHLTDGTLFSERNIGSMQKLARKIITRHCDAAIASSTKAQEKLFFWGMQKEKVFLSLLTINTKAYIEQCDPNFFVEPDDSNKKIILFVGRITYGKGIDLLISALPYITCDYCVYVVGDGDEREIESFMKQAADLGVSDRIVLRGFKSGQDLINEYKSSTVFVLPTREDCFGLVLLEAMCSLKPIVVSKYADGAYDMIENGKNGFIVDPYDARELANALNNVMQNKDLQKEFGKISAQKRDRFSFEKVSKGYLQAIDHVIDPALR